MSLRCWSSPIWLTFVLLSACAAATEPQPQPPTGPWQPTVQVENRSRQKLSIFVMVDGEAKELGLVSADARVRIALPREVVGAVVQFGVASPDGASRTFLQPIFRFRPGMEFKLNLLPEDLPVAVKTTTA